MKTPGKHPAKKSSPEVLTTMSDHITARVTRLAIATAIAAACLGPALAAANAHAAAPAATAHAAAPAATAAADPGNSNGGTPWI
jgi:hypothetical protein